MSIKKALLLAFALMLALSFARALPEDAPESAALYLSEGYLRFMSDIYVICADALDTLSEGLAREIVDYPGLMLACERASLALGGVEWELRAYEPGALTESEAALVYDIEYLYGIKDVIASGHIETFDSFSALFSDSQPGVDNALCLSKLEYHLRELPLLSRLAIASCNYDILKLDLPQEKLESWFTGVALELPAFKPYSAPYETDIDLLLLRQNVLVDELNRALGRYQLDVASNRPRDEAHPTFYNHLIDMGLSPSDAQDAAYHMIDAVLAARPAPAAQPEDSACGRLLESVAPALIAIDRMNQASFNAIAAMYAYEAEPTRDNLLRVTGCVYAARLIVADEAAPPEPIEPELVLELEGLLIPSEFYGYSNNLMDILCEYVYDILDGCAYELTLTQPDMAYVYHMRGKLISQLNMSLEYNVWFRDELMALLPQAEREGSWLEFYGGLVMFSLM